MSTDIRDITPNFLEFWNRASNQPLSVQKELWLELYESPNREIFDIYFSRYGRRNNLETALQKYAEIADEIPAVATKVSPIIEQTSPKCAKLFEQSEHEHPFVLMIGVFNSDAWVTELNGKATTFMAMEVKTNRNTPSAEILIAHEMAHSFHAHCSPLKQNTTTIGEGFILEGLAVLSSMYLVPDEPEAAYLWPGGEQTITGRDCQEWVDECRVNQSYICEQALRDFERDDEDRYAAYFFSRLRTQREGIPLRAGYVIGYDIVKALHNDDYTIAELARWSPERVRAETYQQLRRIVLTR